MSDMRLGWAALGFAAATFTVTLARLWAAVNVTYVRVLSDDGTVARVTADGGTFEVGSDLLRNGTGGVYVFPTDAIFEGVSAAVFTVVLAGMFVTEHKAHKTRRTVTS